jgi:hypothetical protein
MSPTPEPKVGSPKPLTNMPREMRDEIFGYINPKSNIFEVNFATLTYAAKPAITRLEDMTDTLSLKRVSRSIKAQIVEVMKPGPNRLRRINSQSSSNIFHFNPRKDIVLLDCRDIDLPDEMPVYFPSDIPQGIANGLSDYLRGATTLVMRYFPFRRDQRLWMRILKSCADLKALYIVYPYHEAREFLLNFSQNREGPFICYKGPFIYYEAPETLLISTPATPYPFTAEMKTFLDTVSEDLHQHAQSVGRASGPKVIGVKHKLRFY